MYVLFLLVLLFSCTSLVKSSDKDDENALLEMKKQLGDPDFLSSWVVGFEYCGKWYSAPTGGSIHVDCSNVTFGHVTNIWISDMSNLNAPFPKAICSLKRLERIYIYRMPDFYGPLPSCITQLPDLRQFVLRNTSINGSVPNFYNNANLGQIDFGGNHFSGSIPSSLSTLPNLSYIDLSFNYLTGSIPYGLFHHPSPPPLYFDGNVLLLSNNYFTGEIPKCFGLLHFGRFEVSNNQLSGDASFLFAKQKGAYSLILANNSFEFDLTNVDFPVTIQFIDLSHNKIYGKVPASIATAIWWVRDLNLSFNKLCGELPPGTEYFRPGIFANNSCLCGGPLPPCLDSGAAIPSPPPSAFSP